jgi:hypothetical protein
LINNFLALADGKLVMHPTNKPFKVKQIDSIGIWTDAFINYAKVVIDIKGSGCHYSSILIQEQNR